MATTISTSKKVTKVPTQNSITDIIKLKNQFDDVSTIIDVIVYSVTKNTAKYSNATVKKLNLYSKIVDAVFGTDGAGTKIINVIKQIEPISKKDFSLKHFKKLVHTINDLKLYIIQFSNEIANLKDIPVVNTNGIKSVMQSITAILEALNVTTEFKFIKIRLMNLKRNMRNIIKSVEDFGSFEIDTIKLTNSLIKLNSIKDFYAQIEKIFTTIDNSKSVKFKGDKAKSLKKNITKAINLTEFINTLNINDNEFNTSINKLNLIEEFYSNIENIFKLLDSNLYNFTGIKLFNIKRNIRKILNFNTYVASLEINTTSISESINKLSILKDLYFNIINMFSFINNSVSRKNIGLKVTIIKKNITKLLDIQNYIENIKIDKSKVNKLIGHLEPIKDLYTHIAQTLQTIHDIKVPKLILIKIFFIKLTLFKLASMSVTLSLLTAFIPFINIAKLVASAISKFAGMLNSIFIHLNAIKITPITILKLKFIPIIFNELIPIMHSANYICKYIAKTNGFTDIFALSIIFKGLKSIFESIKDISVGIFFKKKLHRIVNALKYFRRIIRIINKIHIRPKAILELLLLNTVISVLSIVFISVILLTPITLLIVPALLALSLAMLVFRVTFKLLMWVIDGLVNRHTFKTLVQLALVGLLLSTIAITFLIVALVSKPIVMSSLWIIGLLGVITIVSIMTLGIGFLFITAAPILLAAVIGLGVMIAIIGIITIMAVMLKVIQILNLDREKIKENVRLVISVCKDIINSIFSADEVNAKKSKDNWIVSMIKGFGKGLSGVVTAIMAVGFLSIMVVSILFITMLAAQLRIIQSLNLKPDKIKANVKAVINTCKEIINTLFTTKEENANESKKSWISSIIEYVGGPIVKVIKAVMAVGFLALMVGAVSMILLIATELRLLQTLNLDPGKVSGNVNLVLSTATGIIDSLFGRSEHPDNESKKSWVISLLEYIGGPIVKIAKAVMAVAFLAVSIGAIMLVQVLAKQLKTISEINLPNDITGKVNSIILSAEQVSSALFNRKDNTIENTKSDTKKRGLLGSFFSSIFGDDLVDLISSIPSLATTFITLGLVSTMVERLNSINNFTGFENVNAKVDEICNSANNIITKINGITPDVKEQDIKKRIGVLRLINDEITKLGKDVKVNKLDKTIDNYIKFIDKVNTVEVKKLETSANMFKQMANFSSSIKGNFEKLAETLAEDLMPILQELKEIMGQVPEKLDTGFQNTSASIAATTYAPTTANVTEQVNRENPNLSKEEVDNIVKTRLNEKAKADANSTISKLDELISLLKGYSGDNVIVKTL